MRFPNVFVVAVAIGCSRGNAPSVPPPSAVAADPIVPTTSPQPATATPSSRDDVAALAAEGHRRACTCADTSCLDELDEELARAWATIDIANEAPDLRERLATDLEETWTCFRERGGTADHLAVARERLLATFRDELCACADASCADATWRHAEVYVHALYAPREPDLGYRLATEMLACHRRLTAAQTSAGVLALEQLRDRACACPDRACAEAVYADGKLWKETHGKVIFDGTSVESRDLERAAAAMWACLDRFDIAR